MQCIIGENTTCQMNNREVDYAAGVLKIEMSNDSWYMSCSSKLHSQWAKSTL